MPVPESDMRSPARRAQDEAIADEPMLSPPDLPGAAVPKPLEQFLRKRKPIAVSGVVENGMVRPLDPAVKLPEHARVIIVAADG